VNKHTPGPWGVTQKLNVSAGRRTVANCGGYQDGGDATYQENIANSRIIAAAPELLEALQMVAAKIARGEGAWSTKQIRQIKNAIAFSQEVPVK